MSVLDDKFDIPRFIAEQRLLEKALTLRYQEIISYIVEQLSVDSEGNPAENYSQTDINRHVSEIMRVLEKDLATYTYNVIQKSFTEGQAHHIATAYALSKTEAKRVKEDKSEKDALLNAAAIAVMSGKTFGRKAAKKHVSTGVKQSKLVRALMDDTFNDILMATMNTEESIKKVVRETTRDVVQYKAMLNRGYSDQAELLKKRLTKKGLSERIVKDGFVGITDKAGRRWDLGTYSNMVVKTKTNQAFRQGLVAESEELGHDLAVISSHGADDKCKDWEGVVVSVSGKTAGYPALSDVIATNEIFHPNCEHSLHSIRNLDQLHKDDIAKHKQNMQKVKGYKNRAYRKYK